MTTSAVEQRTTVKAGQTDDREATRVELRTVTAQLIASLEVERTMRQNLLGRMQAEVERGDRMLAELGIARPSLAR